MSSTMVIAHRLLPKRPIIPPPIMGATKLAAAINDWFTPIIMPFLSGVTVVDSTAINVGRTKEEPSVMKITAMANMLREWVPATSK